MLQLFGYAVAGWGIAALGGALGWWLRGLRLCDHGLRANGAVVAVARDAERELFAHAAAASDERQHQLHQQRRIYLSGVLSALAWMVRRDAPHPIRSKVMVLGRRFTASEVRRG